MQMRESLFLEIFSLDGFSVILKLYIRLTRMIERLSAGVKTCLTLCNIHNGARKLGLHFVKVCSELCFVKRFQCALSFKKKYI